VEDASKSRMKRRNRGASSGGAGILFYSKLEGFSVSIFRQNCMPCTARRLFFFLSFFQLSNMCRYPD